VVFARAPIPGTVKSRLASTVGAQRALEIYTQLAAGIIAALHDPARWELVVRGVPDDALADLLPWVEGRGTLEPQGAGDLGDRMRRALEQHLEGGAERVVIVGTDCPEVTPSVIEAAFGALGDADIVYGPATDGGYYLVGARRAVPEVFHDIPWSDARTLSVSLERAGRAGYRVCVLEPLTDIDTEADWEAWRRRGAVPGLTPKGSPS
jgi:rSAM/selenodomain-associated transferase 1